MLIKKDIIEKCKTFAESRLKNSATLYRNRGEHIQEKIFTDILTGTLGEWGVYDYLNSIGINSSLPDMQLYDIKDKSYQCDLSTNNYDIHVKSQSISSFKKYGYSWLLQKNDNVVINPSVRDIFIFCTVDPVIGVVDIVGIVRALDIHKNSLWGECKISSYQPTKVAIYMNDLIDIDTWVKL